MGIRQEQRERDRSKIAAEVSRRATPPALKQTSTLLIQHGRKKPNHSNNNPPGNDLPQITSARFLPYHCLDLCQTHTVRFTRASTAIVKYL